MSRTPVIAGNWKCNLRLETAHALAESLMRSLEDVQGVEVVVCPVFLHIPSVEIALSMTNIKVGAQDVHWEDDVAATGEVGPRQLEELVDFVIIGHSERRHRFGEIDEAVNKKVRSALDSSLHPIMCVGETLEERQAGRTEQVLVQQTTHGLKDIDVPDAFIIAYEPVWAIGTGTPATADDAESAIALIRGVVEDMFGAAKAESVRILYGGSVTADNVEELMSREGIDGALVGGASLKVRASPLSSRGRCARKGSNAREQAHRRCRATASGKTTLALELAQRFGGEIIGADSRQVYRHMDIGTAKPTPEERAAALHHLVDIIDPDEPFSLGLWLDLALEAVAEIQSRGCLPILVGGTGQYVWALLEGWRVPRVEPDETLRSELNESEPAALLAELRTVDPEAEAYIDPRNVRRVVRAIEVYRATGKPLSFWRTKEPPSSKRWWSVRWSSARRSTSASTRESTG